MNDTRKFWLLIEDTGDGFVFSGSLTLAELRHEFRGFQTHMLDAVLKCLDAGESVLAGDIFWVFPEPQLTEQVKLPLKALDDVPIADLPAPSALRLD